jgi:AmmeMemoRadiSam system protein B
MLRLPAVAGQFYPSNPKELSSLIENYTNEAGPSKKAPARACLVPHAGYMYSGAVAGAVFSRIRLPKKILLVGVRHYPHGEALAIQSEGAWRTPLGDVSIDSTLAKRLKQECPKLREDSVAHSREHSLEVELPFMQVLNPAFAFVPIAVGTHDFAALTETGEGIARVLAENKQEILFVTSSDMNHYEDDETTRHKDRQAIERLLRLDAKGLLDTCRDQEISMCGLGPAVTMLSAMRRLGVEKAELVRYGTSGDINGDRSAVVGYAGMIFS